VFVLFTYSSAVADWYVGGAVGVAMPHDVDDLSFSSGGYSLGISEFSPDTSFTGGVKGGYFSENTPYLGVEINWSISEPDVDKEAVFATITGTPTGVYVGQTSGNFLGSVDVESLSSFAFLAMLRVTDDDAKKEYCGVQLDQADDKKKSLERFVEDLENEIEKAKDLIVTLSDEIKTLSAGIVDLDKSVVEATEQRKAENEEFEL
jgi:hypothetical protein